jgi:hypothetical protein
MNTANILGSHLNPQQTRLFHSFTSPRKRWIWSQQEDHLELLAARASTDALAGNAVVIWYDEESGVQDLLRHYPFYQHENAIYALPGHSSRLEEAILMHTADEGIHHIELYKLAGDLDRIGKPWISLHEELWPGTNRYDLIQKFAGIFNHSNVNPLFYRLSRTMFEISPAEYKRLRNKIEHYIKLNKLRQDGFECLDILDVGLLVNHSLDFVKSEVMQYISILADQATELLKRSDWIMLRYFNYVKSYWVKEINTYVSKIDKLLAHAQELSLTFGDAFSFESSMSHIADKFKGQISRKAKMISQHRKAIKTQYLELLTEIEAGQSWVKVPSVWKENTSLAQAITQLETLRSGLLGSKDAIETHIRSQLKRLNSHNAPENTGLGAELKEWEDDVLKWYNDINVSGYFRTRFESQALSVHKSTENLRDANQSLHAILERQHHLEDYFFWAGFHGQFPDVAKSIVQALQLIPTRDWLTLFDEWYILQLVTGDALEVEWPSLMEEDIKMMIELVRHHTLAEFNNELNRKRALLYEEHNVAIRRMTSRKTMDRREIEHFFQEMSVDKRSEWFPIQLLPLSMLPSAEAMPLNTKNYVLLKAKEPAMDLQWPRIQELACDIFSYGPPVNQRYFNEKLEMPRMMKEFKLGTGRTSAALRYLTNIARQFSPFLPHSCIYTANRVSMISLLGSELDRLILDQLPMPYKISERSLNPDEDFLVETMLEPHKPFVLLVRDFWPMGAWPENSLWHLQFKEDVETVGIKIINSWSKGWLLEPEKEVERLKEEILHYVGTSFTGMQMV